MQASKIGHDDERQHFRPHAPSFGAAFRLLFTASAAFSKALRCTPSQARDAFDGQHTARRRGAHTADSAARLFRLIASFMKISRPASMPSPQLASLRQGQGA